MSTGDERFVLLVAITCQSFFVSLIEEFYVMQKNGMETDLLSEFGLQVQSSI